VKAVLLIAGTDSSGGAGLTRDVQAVTDFDVRHLCVVTAVTAQSDSRVAAVHVVPPEIVCAQIAAAFETGHIGAIKIGMLGSRGTVEAVVESLAAHASIPVVLDPVLVSSSGGVLLDDDGQQVLREMLIPLTTLLTPNVPEAASLLGDDPIPECGRRDERYFLLQAQRVLALGPGAVLLKGGHATGVDAVDWLVERDAEAPAVHRLAAPRLRAARRGTGCSLASAIAAGMALDLPLAMACQRAKDYVTAQLKG
jgi:hydroxymethylpyrimidine/phosphomethylpyrimidine kinase